MKWFSIDRTIDGIPLWQAVARLTFLAVQIALVFYFGRHGAKFFYQAF